MDRLWPRGVKKKDLPFDEWNKNISPSSELRTWFAHDPEKFNEFKKNYLLELKEHIDDLTRLSKIAKSDKLTLLYAAKDPKINHAIILKEAIENCR